MELISKKEFATRLQQVKNGTYGQSSTAEALHDSKANAHSSSTNTSSAAAALRSSSNAVIAQPTADHQSRKLSLATTNTLGEATTTTTIPSVKSYRGQNGVSCVQPLKNVATKESELSLPLGPKHPHTDDHHRVSHDITKHAERGIKVGHGSIFAKETCKTSKGWSAGVF